MSIDLVGQPVPSSIRFERLDANNLVTNFKKINKFIIDNIEYHSAEYEVQANKERKAARLYRPGDLVWLNYKNLRSLRPCKKLDFKNGGPFKIIKPVGKYAFKLELPSTVKIHPVFHVSLLSPVYTNPLPGQVSGPPPPLETETEDPEYEVERIVGIKRIEGEINYIVRWKGYGPEDDWLIPASQSSGFSNLVKDFHLLNPSEPK